MLWIGCELMKKRMMVFGVLIIMIGGLIGLKNYLVLFYGGNEEFKNQFVNIQNLEITQNQLSPNVTFERMSLHIPESFYELEEESLTNNKTFVSREGETPLRIIIGDQKRYYKEVLEDINRMKRLNSEKLMKRYHLQNGVDLFKYYYEHKDEKGNIFWDLNHLKMNSLAATYTWIASYFSKENYFLVKELNGFMAYGNNSYFVTVAQGEEMYQLAFWSNEEHAFTYEQVLDILQSIRFI